MTTPGGVPNLPAGALTLDNIYEALHDMSPAAMRGRVNERMPDIFHTSMGGNPASDYSFFGFMTQLWAGFNSAVANADPADITGPDDLPGLLINFIEDLPIIGDLIRLLDDLVHGDINPLDVITSIENVFNTIGSMLGLAAPPGLAALNVTATDAPTGSFKITDMFFGNHLITVITDFTDAMTGSDWSSAAGIAAIYNAITHVLTGLKDWVLEVLQTLLAVTPPPIWDELQTVFDIAGLTAAVNTFKDEWPAAWDSLPGLFAAWVAFYHFIINSIQWLFTVADRLLGVDPNNAVAIFDLPPLLAALQAFRTTFASLDFTHPLNAIWHSWMAVVDLGAALLDWAQTVITNFLGRRLPDWFLISQLKAAWQTYNARLLAIDWSIWNLAPDFIHLFTATANFTLDVGTWLIDVIANLSGIDLHKLTQAFALDDLRGCWDRLTAAWDGINWSSVQGWLDAADSVLDFANCLLVWAGTVFLNLTGIDLGALYDAFELPRLQNVFYTCGETLAHINWLVEPAGLMAGIGAVITLLQGAGNWALSVINNLVGWDVATVHGMFASIAGFITTIIEYAFGPAAAAAWQDALNLITGISGATPWAAVAAIYHQFQDVLALFGNPLGIGTGAFNVTTAIEHFITTVLNPTGLIGGAEDFAHNLADTFVNTFLNLSGSSFTISDVIRAIQSIPANLMTGPFDVGQLSHLNIGALSSFLPNFLVNGNFDSPNSIIGQGLWTWDGTTGPGSLFTSVFTDAAGVIRELYSDVVSVAQGMALSIAGWTKWSGLSGGTIALTVAKFDAARTLLGYDTVAAAASPSGTQSVWQPLTSTYTVPSGVAYVFVRPFVGADVTAGRVWFGGISAKPTATTLNNPLVPILDASKIGTGQFAQSMVTNLTTDISTITSNVSARALQTDLTNTWNTVITALGGTGTGLAGVQSALLAIPGANISGSVTTITTNIQNLMDAILSAFDPGYVAGSGTLASITGALQAIPQLNITNLVSGLSAKALAADLTALLNNLGLGVATLTAISNRFANLSAAGTMAQSAITNLVSDLGGKALAADLTALMSNLGLGAATLTAITARFANLSAAGTMPQSAIGNLISDLNARALVSDLTALMSNLGLGTATLSAITARFATLSATGTMAQTAITNLTTDLTARAMASDLTALMSNLGLGTATLTAISNRLANLSAAGTMPQSAITNLVTNLNTLTSGVNNAALASDLTALMGNLGAGTATLTAISSRFTNLSAAGIMAAPGVAGLDASKIISGTFSNAMSPGLLPQSLWQQSVSGGANQILSPGFEDATIARNSGSASSPANAVFGYTTAQAHGGTQSYSIQTSTDATGGQWDYVYLPSTNVGNPNVYQQMTKAQPGQWFYTEIYIRAKSTNTAAGSSAIYWGMFWSNAASSGATSTATWAQSVYVTTISTTGWTKLSGWLQVPAGYDLACALIAFGSQNVGAQTYYIDDARCVENTQAQALVNQLFGGNNILSAITPPNIPGIDASKIISGQFAQSAITNLTSDLSAKALTSDLNALMSNIGSGTATLAAVSQRLQQLNSAGTYQAALPITQISQLSNYLTNMSPSGVLNNIFAVTGLPGYLNNISSTGVISGTNIINSINAISGLPGYLSNLNTSGVLNGINAVSGLATHLSKINPASGVLDAASGLSGIANIANIPTSLLTRSNISDLGKVYTSINTNVGSGCIIYRSSTATVSISANAGAQLLPASFFDAYADTASSDLTVTLSAGRFQVSLTGWYRLDICIKIQPNFSAIWNICPVLFVNGSMRAYGHDSISFYTVTTGGASPRFLQSSFLVYLNANDYAQAGFDAANNTGTISNVLTGGNPAGNYFSIALENRSLA